MTWKFDGDSKSDIVLSPNDSLDHKSPISLYMDKFEYFFFFDLEIWWGFQIPYCTFPKWLSGPQKSNFLVFLPIWIFFSSLIWKFDGDSKSDIVLHLKWFTGPQKFMIMIRCKINFWFNMTYCNICSYSIFVWSYGFLNFVFSNVVILVFHVTYWWKILRRKIPFGYGLHLKIVSFCKAYSKMIFVCCISTVPTLYTIKKIPVSAPNLFHFLFSSPTPSSYKVSTLILCINHPCFLQRNFMWRGGGGESFLVYLRTPLISLKLNSTRSNFRLEEKCLFRFYMVVYF